MRLKVGDVAEVLGLPEILATLDARGMLRGVPFMPEMARFCGERFRVSKVATKTCDTIDKTGFRKMSGSVLLDGLHCDGAFHGGCEASCPIFWREEWLKRVVPAGASTADAAPLRFVRNQERAAEADRAAQQKLLGWTTRPTGNPEAPTAFVCQITQMKEASAPWAWWDPRPYLHDLASGNRRLGEVLRALAILAFNWVQALRGGCGYPHMDAGALKKTPASDSRLQAGDLVRIKDETAIIATLDLKNRNRGLWLDSAMLQHCGRTCRVARRVQRIINERTGQMTHMAPESPIILLAGLVCNGDHHRLCPRSEYYFWREAWLEKVEPQ